MRSVVETKEPGAQYYAFRSPRSTQFIITTRIGVLVYEMNVSNLDTTSDLYLKARQANNTGADSDNEIEVKQLRSINSNCDNRFSTSVVWFPQGEVFATVNSFSVKKFVSRNSAVILVINATF